MPYIWKAMALSYNLGYQEIISVHPTRRQIVADKPYSTFPNIWQWLLYCPHRFKILKDLTNSKMHNIINFSCNTYWFFLDRRMRAPCDLFCFVFLFFFITVLAFWNSSQQVDSFCSWWLRVPFHGIKDWTELNVWCYCWRQKGINVWCCETGSAPRVLLRCRLL